MERFCLDCLEPLKGRADKKFCDDLCRNNYNNRLKAGAERFITETNQILKRNREILKHKIQSGQTKIAKTELLFRGFNFNFHTCCYQRVNGDTLFFCYDVGYIALDGDDVILTET